MTVLDQTLRVRERPVANPGRGKKGRRRPVRRRRGVLAAAAFLSPVVASLVLFRLAPAISAARLALFQGFPGSVKPPHFVGFQNFHTLLTSPSFWNSVRQTLIFSIIVNPFQIGVALLLAFLLTRRLSGAGAWRTLIFLPAAVPILGSTIIWGIALRPEGPINGVVQALGGNAQPFLTSPSQVIWCLVLIASWIGIGYWMMFLIAGIQDIPTSLYEAATIDGAGTWRQFAAITIPLLRRPLLFVLVADTVANFVLFAPIQVLTDGGPQEASNFLMFDIYHHQFELSDPYTAAAELLILLILMLTVVALQFRLLQGDDS